ncbi:hypothetical protein AXX17_ATUG04870 [Arabidopsis thaliana]|uniref:Pyruvate kinase n=1 Tax=Arabidopsis thaliana TaxID=3702 RepID=A0A178U603_ARATH|nr:hypothetical protein AXX17_ATUG04870 [Arabidopsis thaliana]
MIGAGMNVARLNMAHGELQDHGDRITRIRQAAGELNALVPILMDIKGPEVRIGKLAEPGELKAGEKLTLTTEIIVGDTRRISVNYANLPSDVKPGNRILIDDGLIELTVDSVTDTEIECVIVNGGMIKSNKGVNLPGIHTSLPGVTERDIMHIKYGVEQKVDIIAPSFVRRAEDIWQIRGMLEELGAPHIQIISKIENQEGVTNLDSIIEASDGIMVARGDLGVEIPVEEVPMIQREMIEKCNRAGKPVIVATHMLDSMQVNPRPTRAEVSDVANAVIQGTDSVMLSGETAAGKYPVESIATMANIAIKAESMLDYTEQFKKRSQVQPATTTEIISQAVVSSSLELGAKAILTPTESGFTARMVSKYRPKAPVIAIAYDDNVLMRLCLLWGVIPVRGEKEESTDAVFASAVHNGRKTGLLTSGDHVVISAGTPIGKAEWEQEDGLCWRELVRLAVCLYELDARRIPQVSYRIEKDFLGDKEVPLEAYYGVQTIRALENFPITGIPVHFELFSALAKVKKAAARANAATHMLPQPIADAIVQAADEVAGGMLADQFIVDSIQGGAGTSINMNMNEVLANRALEIMGHAKGEYFYCNPNNHVNMAQSTNDAVPTALKIAAYQLAHRLLDTLAYLHEAFLAKAAAFDDVIKMGRTHLQDAVPIRLGQEFGAYAAVIGRDRKRIASATAHLLAVNLGATAVGTGLNAKPEYIAEVVRLLAEDLNIPLVSAEDLVDATQNTDAYTELSAALKVCAVNLSKICNDIRMMASGPRTGLSELALPPRQPGSSIMPGKVNPVMAEVVNQTAFQVMGNDHTICLASEAGQFELNVMGPVIALNLLQSLKILRNAVDVFVRFAIEGLEANRERGQSYVKNSFGIVTALNPHLGYEVAAGLVKEALRTGLSIQELILERHLLSKEEMDIILDPMQMTTPGIAGEWLIGRDGEQ